jgi:uncharacterized protein YdeI (YjbR/CyaY-like superfamily)
MKPLFFAEPSAFRKWLAENHASQQELFVGFHKRGSGKASLTWPESVDAALCFGWIDGVRTSLGETSYVIRFTPRKPTSNWSAINIRRVAELKKLGLMHAAGLAAFAKRSDEKSAIYAYEQRKAAKLSAVQGKVFRAKKKAWEFFQAQPAWYRRTATYWVISAKKEETREKRLGILMEESGQGRTIRPLRRTEK